MNKPASGLPEKSYFSATEIAERWNIPIADVQHYLEQGMLRPAIKPTDLDGTIKLVNLEIAVEPAERNGGNVRAPAIFPFLYIVQGSVVGSLDERNVSLAMLDANDFTEALDFSVTVVEDFDGCRYQLVFEDDPYHEVRFDISELISCQNRAGKFVWDWHPERTIITREERDRFERNHGVRLTGGSVVPAVNYTTIYMDIMHQAIATFFEPRQRLDAKREQVETWIAERLEAAGTEGSKHIARAMFTIIKPSDHNPRKRRG